MIDDPSRGTGPRAVPPEPASPTDDADRLNAAAPPPHLPRPAPRRLRDQLVRAHLAPPRPWRSWAAAFTVGAAAAAIATFLAVHTPTTDAALVDEAVGDHLRIVSALHPLAVESNDIH